MRARHQIWIWRLEQREKDREIKENVVGLVKVCSKCVCGDVLWVEVDYGH